MIIILFIFCLWEKKYKFMIHNNNGLIYPIPKENGIEILNF